MESISRRLFAAIRAGNLHTTRELLEGNKDFDVNTVIWEHSTPLHVACHVGNLQIVKYLIQEAKANVNTIDPLGKTPLYQACSIDISWTENVIGTVKFLLANGANIHVRTTHGLTFHITGNTALHAACRCGRIQVIQELLNHGAEVNAQNDRGETPLLHACFSEPTNICMIQLLLANNADRHIEWYMGWGPMIFPRGEKRWQLQRGVFESYDKLSLAVSVFDDDTHKQHAPHKMMKCGQQHSSDTVRLNPRLSQHQHALAIKAMLLVRKLPVHEVAYEIVGFLSPGSVEKIFLVATV